jgi:hypothetical protein
VRVAVGGTAVFVEVRVKVAVGSGVLDAVDVRVAVGGGVFVGVAVLVRVAVGVCVKVGVEVPVKVDVAVAVQVAVCVEVSVPVAVGVNARQRDRHDEAARRRRADRHRQSVGTVVERLANLPAGAAVARVAVAVDIHHMCRVQPGRIHLMDDHGLRREFDVITGPATRFHRIEMSG